MRSVKKLKIKKQNGGCHIATEHQPIMRSIKKLKIKKQNGGCHIATEHQPIMRSALKVQGVGFSYP
jgi:hypothetical protein